MTAIRISRQLHYMHIINMYISEGGLSEHYDACE